MKASDRTNGWSVTKEKAHVLLILSTVPALQDAWSARAVSRYNTPDSTHMWVQTGVNFKQGGSDWYLMMCCQFCSYHVSDVHTVTWLQDRTEAVCPAALLCAEHLILSNILYTLNTHTHTTVYPLSYCTEYYGMSWVHWIRQNQTDKTSQNSRVNIVLLLDTQLVCSVVPLTANTSNEKQEKQDNHLEPKNVGDPSEKSALFKNQEVLSTLTSLQRVALWPAASSIWKPLWDRKWRSTFETHHTSSWMWRSWALKHQWEPEEVRWDLHTNGKGCSLEM